MIAWILYLGITAGMVFLWFRLYSWLRSTVNALGVDMFGLQGQEDENGTQTGQGQEENEDEQGPEYNYVHPDKDKDPNDLAEGAKSWEDANVEDISQQLQAPERLKQKTQIKKLGLWGSLELSMQILFLATIPLLELIWSVSFALALVFSLALWVPLVVLFFSFLVTALGVFEKQEEIPKINAGELAFKGGRTKLILEEGLRFLPLWCDIEKVDLRERTLSIEPFWVKASDKIRVRVSAEIQWRPINIHDFLEVENGEKFLKNFIQSVIRGQVASHSGEDAQIADGGNLIYKGLARTVLITSEEEQRGIIIDTIDINDVTLPDPIEKSQEKKQEALNEKAAKMVETKSNVERLRTLRDISSGVPDEELINTIQAEDGKIDKKEIVHNLESLEDVSIEDLGEILGYLV